ncbi:HEAT repeat domain-containing protein [Mucilaginibacter ximonensis]|uniref:HEAT repeat domain-containing protein n=1 Tax=Mucilaginibacter ximonensis TaxID=538021 RepID=A0ABW5YD32_9SPHI
MKCEHYREMFLDQKHGMLGEAEQAALQQHLNSCAACREELAAVQLIWNKLGEIAMPEPSEKMELKFHAMLNDFKQAASEPGKLTSWKERVKQLWQLQYRMPLAYAILAVVLGIGATLLLQSNSRQQQQLQAMQTQLHELKQTMMLAMLDNPLASERIKAVSYTSDIKQPDKMVIEALLETLNNDPNVNVRLSTLEALSQMGNYPEVRSGLIQSITTQDSPLVQTTIADVMLKLQEKRAVHPFKELLKQKDLDEVVRQKIKTTIGKLI